jgi:hypothetical protein
MLMLVIHHHPHRTAADLRRKQLVRCLGRHAATLIGLIWNFFAPRRPLLRD